VYYHSEATLFISISKLVRSTMKPNWLPAIIIPKSPCCIACILLNPCSLSRSRQAEKGPE
jgi:hypothetical protein